MTAQKELLFDFRNDEELQAVELELAEALTRMEALKNAYKLASAVAQRTKDEHKQARLNSYAGRGTKSDVKNARAAEEEAAVELERIEAQLQLSTEDIERLRKCVDDAKVKAITAARARQRAALFSLIVVQVEALDRFGASVAAVQRFNQSLSGIPAEGVIPESRETSYLHLYMPGHLLDFLDPNKALYIVKNMLQILERLDPEEYSRLNPQLPRMAS